MDWSNGAMLAVVLVVAGFALGNFMGMKPKAHEVRTADFRLLARQNGLYPKLVLYPDWLPIDRKQSMIAQYALIIDEISLPMGRYLVEEECWHQLDQQQANKQTYILAKAAIALPERILPLVLGLQIKANSILIYWQDERYQHAQSAQKLDTKLALEDLTTLKSALEQWAWAVQNHR